ncbi:MAG: peptide deformylase [Verrucomicrobiota bacterium]
MELFSRLLACFSFTFIYVSKEISPRIGIATVEADGLLARALQHEIDHLNGILFIDRLSAVAKVGMKRKIKRLMEEWEEDGLIKRK